MFNGLTSNLGDLAKLSNAKTRSICPENFTGEKGKGGMATEGTGAHPARDLGQGWKISPSVNIPPHTTFTLADIHGEGAIKHMWITGFIPADARWTILRIYWDDSDIPAVESPLGDFFCASQANDHAQINSLAVCVNPKVGLNCYWTMPFKKRARITLENISDENTGIYYQIDYVETKLEDDIAYFCARFNRTNPLPYKSDYTIIDKIQGKGQYVGTYIFWGVNNNGWWGEGEIKFFMDGDTDFPTICGTGTEDYFCGSHNFDVGGQYREFSSPYSGLTRVTRGDGAYKSNQRFAMYRWHIADPIYFENDLRVTIQALGWRNGGKYLPLQDDISSVAFWYQTAPFTEFSPLPDRDYLEII